MKLNVVFLCLSYLFYLGHLGIIAPYLGVFLDGRGLSSESIGQLVAIMTVSRLIAPNLWASLADKSGKGLLIIRIGSFIALMSFLMLFVLQGFWGIALGLILSIGFWTSILPQLEQLALATMQGDSTRYSRVRLWGSVGFIMMSVVCGILIDWRGSEMILWCSSAMLACLFGVSHFLSQPPQQAQVVKKGGSIWKLVSGKSFIFFILAMMLLQMSFGPYYSFFALYMRDLGFSGQQTGWIISLGVAAEIVLFLIAGKLLGKMGIKNALMLCLFATSIRWMILAMWPSSLVLLLSSQLIHALSFAFAHTAAIQFVHQYFGEQFQSRGQALYVSISYGLGGAIGSFIAGQLWLQGAGAFTTWMVAATLSFLGVFSVLVLKLR